MSSAIKYVKQAVQRWKHKSLSRLSSDSDSGSGSSGGRMITPPGCLAIYAGAELRRFVVPTRYLKLPVFLSLLNLTEEEFGFRIDGGLVLPCDAEFLEGVLEFLERDEHRYGGLGLDGFINMFSDVGFGSCKERESGCGHGGFTPLLEKNSGLKNY
ncbi:hypothetical protein Vadar_006910 [Vaccinium darrowii]|uniref:Uncharacterized protein n=1 Tax=Vaccinium darrowii TaxID=229202 RepID=A0ACB7Y6P0_9ERIC|nr:hypothetical protein Vadar_006910 [Vaccinium darrowii]